MNRSKLFSRIAMTSGIGAMVLMAGAGQAGAATAGPVAGYTAPPSANPTQTVAVTFGVPKADCKKTPTGGFQAVLTGVRLEVSGGDSGAGAVVVCAGPMAVYLPLIQINGSSIGSGITVNPGDTVSTTVSEGPSGTSVTLTDGAQSQTASGPGGSATAESIGAISVNCTGSTCSPVPKVAQTSFSAGAIDGMNLAAAGSVQGNLTDAAGATEMSSTALRTKKTLNSFKAKWVLSCSGGTAGGC